MAPLTRGDTREDGKLFWSYQKGRARWLCPETFHRYHVQSVLSAARARARTSGYPATVSLDYLVRIWPEDGLCPIFNRPMLWASINRNLLPSLDKRVPGLGYVPDNVSWISLEANRIKDNASIETLSRLVEYMKKPPIHGNKTTERQ